MWYWMFKWLLFAPGIRLLCRPWVEGREHVPRRGAVVLVCNHLSAGDTILVPAVLPRKIAFPAKAELFTGHDLKTRIVAWFVKAVGQRPMDRSGGRASARGMDAALEVLAEGQVLAIFPEGTRSPDGRLYKGKTGVARLVLNARVPVLPVAVINTELRRRLLGVPWMWRPGVRVGKPLDFTAYAAAGNDREVLRWVTDEIMYAVMQLSGQTYVDVYASSVKEARRRGEDIEIPVLGRPGLGRPVPPLPDAEDAA